MLIERADRRTCTEVCGAIGSIEKQAKLDGANAWRAHNKTLAHGPSKVDFVSTSLTAPIMRTRPANQALPARLPPPIRPPWTRFSSTLIHPSIDQTGAGSWCFESIDSSRTPASDHHDGAAKPRSGPAVGAGPSAGGGRGRLPPTHRAAFENHGVRSPARAWEIGHPVLLRSRRPTSSSTSCTHHEYATSTTTQAARARGKCGGLAAAR